MSERILIVDDKAANRRLLKTRLEAEYFLVDEVVSGTKALEKLNLGARYDLVITDLAMPDMDGISFCKKLRSDDKLRFTPVFLVTARSDPEARVLAFEAGCDDYIERPLNFKLLLTRVRASIRARNELEQLFLRFGEKLKNDGPRLRDQSELFDTTVVLVEPDSLVRTSIAGSLRSRGIIVVEGDQLPIAPGWPSTAIKHDLLIVNAGLRGLGLKAVSEIKAHANGRAKPVLLIMYELDELDEVQLGRGLELGVTDYLVKPVRNEEILHRSILLLERQLQHDRLRQMDAEAVDRSERDQLTGLFNRHHLELTMSHQFESLQKGGRDGCFLLFDLDGLKSVNDSAGHAAGDVMIRQAADTIKDTIRATDLCFRIGGDEFFVFLPNTDQNGGERLVERILMTTSSDGSRRLEFSVGLTVCSANGSEKLANWQEGLACADEAMYRAKRAGGNQLVCWEPL
jgi:two-component system cell cycle response regulator